MGFSSISITGFRSIAKLHIEGLQQINLFVGKNNCGKTTVLESIFVLAGATNPSLLSNTNKFRDYGTLRKEDFLLFFNALNLEKPIVFHATETDKTTTRQLTIEPIISYMSDDSLAVLDTMNIKGLSFDYNYKAKHTKHIVVKTKIQYLDNRVDIDVKDIEKQRYIEKLAANFINTNAIMNNLAARVSEIIKAKQKQQIIAILQTIEPTIIDIHTDDGTVYFDMGLKVFLPIHVAGDGMRRILSLVTIIFQKKNGIAIIDEIDNGLHHASQAIMWKALMVAAREFNVQIFATTHSNECIQALATIAEANYHNQNIAALFRIEKKQDEHRAFLFNQELLAAAIDNNFEIR
jgi:AAA15 family ATPase/GTPase